ncbi:MAG: hypothetical protein ABI981_09005 [Betaproteobacteria bacterium]
MRVRLAVCVGALALAALVACEHKPTKDEEEAVKNTFACQLAGQRMVIRFDTGEVRILTATAEKITLYQISSPSLLRYSNGSLELRGNVPNLTLIEYGVATKLEDCKPYAAPKP